MQAMQHTLDSCSIYDSGAGKLVAFCTDPVLPMQLLHSGIAQSRDCAPAEKP
jgi:hypothetical protein